MSIFRWFGGLRQLERYKCVELIGYVMAKDSGLKPDSCVECNKFIKGYICDGCEGEVSK